MSTENIVTKTETDIQNLDKTGKVGEVDLIDVVEVSIVLVLIADYEGTLR